ncbi:hypothetical protein SH661x_002595 [Planctomicrobium sp. SH661]|uniref:beta-propeller domain-containing protein n=1 Tax=Planctomicrobium sp. SH661 TaxID=3448124 RepID=UPI003F5C35DC
METRIFTLAVVVLFHGGVLLSGANAEEEQDSKGVKHRVIVCEYSGANHRLAEFDEEGALTWQHPFPTASVCFQIAPNGNVLFADGGHPGRIQEVNRDHQVLFDYQSKCEQVLGFDLLPSGNVLLAEQGPCQAVEVDREGKIVRTVPMSTTEKVAHLQTRCIHQLSDGHVLAAHEGEGVVREYDQAGKVVWEYPGVTQTFEAIRLANGNTLIGCGTQKRIIEVTPEKQIVWELTAADIPEVNLSWVTGLQVLENGNVVVANFLRGQEGRGAHAFEVTRDQQKRLVWKFANHDLIKSISMVRVLDAK